MKKKNKPIQMMPTDKELKKIKKRQKSIKNAIKAYNSCIMDYRLYIYKKNIGEAFLPSTEGRLLSFKIEFEIIDKDYDEKSKNEIKQRWYIGENEKVILFNGRLDNQKGLYYLLEGFRELLRQNPNCRLFAVGDGSFKTYLKHSAEIWSKVSFTGYIDFGLIKQLYKIADIGIIPSVYDHCPYVALEMMLNKIPLVISNIEGLNEIFLPGLDCLVINPSYTKEGNLFFEKDEMAKNMYKLLNNAELANKLAENAYIKVTEKFSVERMVAETVEVYHAALKSG